MSDILEEPDRTASATEARNRLSRLISRAEFSGDRTVLTRHGEPVAALVSLDDVKRARESIEDARQNGGTKSLEEFREELKRKREA